MTVLNLPDGVYIAIAEGFGQRGIDTDGAFAGDGARMRVADPY